MLALEMRQKGLPEEAARSALESVDEQALADEAARKRAPRLKDLEWKEFRQKLSGFLGRRGFPYDVVSAAVTRSWNELHAGQEQILDDEEHL
jgi:SOS response regulatory protein OraA/RecX